MEILLLEKVENLGLEGDIVKVADGYARNFLIPRKKAVKASKGTVELQQHIKEKRVLQMQTEREEVLALAEKIANCSLTIPVKVGEEDKLYGSVTSKDIAEMLKVEGVVVDRKDVQLSEPIRSLGVYLIKINIHSEVQASLKLWVVKE